MRRFAWLACVGLLAVGTHAGAVPAPRAIDRVRDLFPKTKGWFSIAAGLEYETDADGRIAPRYTTLTHKRVRWKDGAERAVLPRFPAAFGGATRIGQDGDQSFFVEVTAVAGRAAAARSVEDGLVVYADAFADTDVLFKSTPTHTDEYLLLRTARAPTEWRYTITRGPTAARLRQAGNAIEVVDASGTPWLRAAAPFAVDRAGHRADGTIRLEGEDTLVLALDAKGLTPPILVDPDWSSTGDMSFGRFYHRMNMLPDGRVFVTGGCSASVCSGDLRIGACRTTVAAAEVLDFRTRTFTRVADDLVGRYYHSAEVLPDGTALVAGGCTTSDCSSVTARLTQLVLGEKTFTPLADLSEARAGLASAQLLDGRVLFIGGCTLAGCTGLVEAWDPVKRTLSKLAPMQRARGRATLTMLADGRLLVAGGCTNIDCGAVIDAVEVYDPSVNQWTLAAPMKAPRAGHWAAPLPDGRVLLGGGCRDQACTMIEASAEIFDPKTNATVAAPAMATARFGSQAVALPSGDVLVSQGCESATVCDTSNELFDAAAGVFKPFAPAVTKRAFHALLYDPKSHLVMANGGCEPSTCSWWSETFDLASMSPPIVDAGKRTPQPDAGKPGPIAATGGCGCEHAPVGAIGWPAIGALALVLRRVLRRRPSRGASA